MQTRQRNGATQLSVEQSLPLLATKLHIPQTRHDLTPRPLLFEKLNHELSSKLTLVHEARQRLGKVTLRTLSYKASRWYAAQGLQTEAIEAALTAQEFAWALNLSKMKIIHCAAG